ncbi:MAG: recombinase RecA [PVC group bacterium]|nr:recombinase RecA [PVC group bacterium]
MTITEKQKAIDEAVAQVEKQFGKGSIMKLGDDAINTKIESISTGSIGLDGALGIGGLPRGRVVEIYGPEMGGKTTLTLHVIAEAQKVGGVAAFIDAEHALSTEHSSKLGVDVKSLYISQPDYGEQALEITETLVRSNAFDIIVVDSVAALVPKAEIEGDMGDSHMALQARLMSQALRKLTGVVSKSKTCLIFINQIRSKIGVMFGSPETTSGGNALKFYSSVRLDIRRIESIKVRDEVIGNRVRVKVVKNKVAPPFKQAEFELHFNSGINQEAEVVDLAVAANIVEKAHSWYSYQGEKLGQGKESVKDFLENNPKVLEEITEKITNSLLNKNEISDIALAVEVLYDLRDDANIMVKDAKKRELEWDGKKFTYRKLIKYIEKNDLYKKLKEKVEEKNNQKEDEENKINS